LGSWLTDRDTTFDLPDRLERSRPGRTLLRLARGTAAVSFLERFAHAPLNRSALRTSSRAREHGTSPRCRAAGSRARWRVTSSPAGPASPASSGHRAASPSLPWCGPQRSPSATSAPLVVNELGIPFKNSAVTPSGHHFAAIAETR
jgi:hypothetical protein